MRFTLAFVLVAVAATSIAAQAPPRDSAEVRRQLLAIEDEIARANRECDYKYFAFIEADEFIFTTARGSVMTKKDDLAGEKDCQKNSNMQTLDEVIVQLHGTVAVLSARSTTVVAGQPAPQRSRFTDVFVWRAGRWQLVAGHSSRIPPTPLP